MSKETKNNIMIQGSILAMAGILTRLIGIAYRIPMSNMLGVQGNGLYSVAFGIYNVTLTLSSYSLPLAVSKLMSHYYIKNEYKNSFHVFRTAFIFALVVGLVAGAGIYFGADFLEISYKKEGLSKPLKIVAPTIFVMALLGVLRGFFQGKQTMIPTAFSQILEQIVNAVVSVYSVYLLMNIYINSGLSKAYGAAGGFLGTFLGASTGLVFLFLLFMKQKMKMKQLILEDNISSLRSNGFMSRLLLLTIIPVALSQTVYQVGYAIDDLIFSNVMYYKGFNQNTIDALQGVFNSQYNLLINVPVAVASAMAVSSIPAMAESITKGNTTELVYRIRSVIKFNMILAFPSAVGLAVLSKPIMILLFPSLVEYHELASRLLLVGSSAVIFYVLSTITSGILQGINQMIIPVKHAAISLVLHIILILGLLMWTNMGVYALIVGNITFPLLIVLLNYISIRKFLDYKQDKKKTIILPGISSVIMGIGTWGSYSVVYKIINHNGISLVFSILFSFGLYFLLILIFQCFSREEMYELPMGGIIYRISRKLRLLN
jgi:stage V sporulation protein B